MSTITPPLNTRGRYILKAPWSADPKVVYTCKAIRSFEDLYKLGQDVERTYYHLMGLTPESGFSFAEEQQREPNLITLMGSDGSVIYVPDTYISSYPDTDVVNYQHVVLSASLGALPDYLDLGALTHEVGTLIASMMGVSVEVKPMICPSINVPTREQHETLEAARTGSITMFENDYTRVAEERLKNQKLQEKVDLLTDILVKNNLMSK